MSALIEWAHQAPSDDFWSAVIFLVILAGVGFIGAFYFFSRKRIIEDTPTSRIRSAPQGYVELNGTGLLMEGPPNIAPLTGTHCTWYSYEIEERRRSGKRSHWTTIETGTSEELFLLKDDTGSCIIDPEGAYVTPGATDSWYGSTVKPQRGPATGSGFLAMGRYRYTEKRLHPKESLYAIGLFKTVGGEGAEFDIKGDVRDLLREWKRNSQAMLNKYDENRDGEIDMEEWGAIREAALKEVMARYRELKSEPPVNMMSNTRDSRRPYILSAVPQDGLIRRFQYYSLALILLFFVTGAAVTWLIGLRMGST